MKKIKLACYIPPRKAVDQPVTYANPGFIPAADHEKLIKLLTDKLPKEFPEVDLVDFNLDFTQSIIFNNELYIKNNLNLNKALDAFFWYAKIAKIPNHSHIDKLKTLSANTLVVNNPYSYERALDKLNAHKLLKENGIPVADYFAFDIKPG